jgi:hypothetical protein
MLAPCRSYSSVMSLSSRDSSPPKRPRLSLQIRTPSTAQTFGKSSTALKADIDPTSPTAFNTLSNAYAAAIENSSPRTARPLTNLDSKAAPSGRPTLLRLETKLATGDGYVLPSQRTQTPGPFTITYPDTPSSAISSLTPITAHPNKKSMTPCTFTPPLSASSTDSSQPRFTFTANTAPRGSVSSPRTQRRRATIGSQYQIAPYTHPRSLHSILRNSPLPPRSTVTPSTPSRMSMRLANRAEKKVGYNDPLTQTITTNKYVKSHIDLLTDDSPYSATDPESAISDILDLTMAYTGNETRDGGQTPGPFEEMRRRMAESELETPAPRKRKREKKRKWEWTITTTEGGEESEQMDKAETPITAIKVEATPKTAIWREVSVSTDEASEAESSRRDESVESSIDSQPFRKDLHHGVPPTCLILPITVEFAIPPVASNTVQVPRR